VGSNNLVFDSLVIQLDCMFSIVAAEDKEIFDSKLVLLAPSDFESSLVNFALTFQCFSVQKIKDLFVINLEE